MAQIFPKWTNQIPIVLLVVVLGGITFITFVFWYWFSPWNLDVGFQPVQPVPYSHKLHAGDLGMDCRYCHTGVEFSAVAGVPPTERCMNCHTNVRPNSLKLEGVMKSWQTGLPIPWQRIHKIPDYAYFDHSAHINVGVGCVSCHGRVDQMEQVRQVKPLSMSFCLECHRNPAPHLRPLDKVTDMNFSPTDEWMKVAKIRATTLHPPVESCSGCHR